MALRALQWPALRAGGTVDEKTPCSKMGRVTGVAQLVGASSCKPKSCGFGSWSGHVPGFSPQPKHTWEATDRCFSFSLPPSLSIINKHVIRQDQKKVGQVGLWVMFPKHAHHPLQPLLLSTPCSSDQNPVTASLSALEAWESVAFSQQENSP